MKTQLDGSNLLESIMRDLPKKPVMACRHLVFVVPVKTAYAYCTCRFRRNSYQDLVLTESDIIIPNTTSLDCIDA